MSERDSNRLAGRVANQLGGERLLSRWRNQVINAHTVCVLLKWKDFRSVPRPLLPLVYVVVLDELEVVPDSEQPTEPKVKLVRFAQGSSEAEQLHVVGLAVKEAKREHDRMSELKLLLRQLRGLVGSSGVRSVDDLVSACKGYSTESEELGRAAQRRRRPEVFRPMPGSALPEACELQLLAASFDLIGHAELRVGSMPLRLALPNADHTYPAEDRLNEQQRNARVVWLVNDLSPKADELRLGSGLQPASAQEAYAILPPNPQLNNGYASAVLDGLDQLNYARYLADAQGADSLPPDARVQTFDRLFAAVRQVLQQMPSAGEARQ